MYQLKDTHDNFTLAFFCGITIILIIIGCLFVYSSSWAYALHIHNTAHYYLFRHIIGIALGFFGIIFLQLFSPMTIKKINRIFFPFFIIITVLTITGPFSRQINGSCRWLSIKSFMFQPSELLKHAMLIFFADFLSNNTIKKCTAYRQYLFLFFITSFISFIFLQQPDFGLTITLIFTLFLLLFIANYNLYMLSAFITLFMLSSLLLIFVQPYRVNRIVSFLQPWQDPQGKGFQLIQSFTSLGLGSWFGDGIGFSKQKFFYLPMQHTDFIFSIIGEELGLVGTICISILFMLFTFFGYKLACNSSNLFSFFTIVGYTTFTTLQAIINMCVTTGLVPPKGMGLPFISYGNTALVCNLWMIGIIITIIRHTRTEHNYANKYFKKQKTIFYQKKY